MPNQQKPFAVFVFTCEGTPASTRYGGFARRLQKAGALPGHDIITIALENLVFCFTEDGGLDVFDAVSGVRLADATFVYLKSWEAVPEEAAALALYLTHQGVPFMDTLVTSMGVSKLAMAVRLWAKQVPVPASIYIRNADKFRQVVTEKAPVMFGDRFVMKDILGQRGRHNYLVTIAEAQQVINDNPGIQFICQRFIPSTGDYRVGVFAGKARFIMHRRMRLSFARALNNTTARGRAECISPEAFPQQLRQLAVNATAAAGLQIAGADIIIDETTGCPYVLEVNQGSQIVTGAFVPEKIASFVTALNEIVGGNTPA